MDVPDTPDKPDRESEIIAYEDGDGLVLCDRSNPGAWIRLEEPVGMPASPKRGPQSESR